MSDLTMVELTWIEKRIERWIRFGKIVEDQIIDRRRRMVGFAPGSVFAFVRWASNDYGTIVSRIDILRGFVPGEAYSTVPFVKPGGEILLRLTGWPKVEQVLRQIDAVEQLDIKPEEAAPDHWRHVHNRLTAGEQPRSYTRPMHNAWTLRRKGAIGLMQIMPETYMALRQAFGLGADPYQPRDNIMAGAGYLREMLDLYGTSGFLASYNAGPTRYNEHLTTGEPLPEETQIYLSRLAPMLSGAQVGNVSATANPVTWMTAPLFIDDNSMSNSGAVQVDNGGFPSANSQPNQQPINARASNAIAALAPQSGGLFIHISAGTKAQLP